MGDISKNFSRREFECNPEKCGCGYNDIDLRVVAIAQAARDALGESIRISSGCRCVSWNANPEVRGVPGSWHTKGKAADLVCASGSKRLYEVLQALFKAGKIPALAYCKRYIKKNFVHIDVGARRSNRFTTGN